MRCAWYAKKLSCRVPYCFRTLHRTYIVYRLYTYKRMPKRRSACKWHQTSSETSAMLTLRCLISYILSLLHVFCRQTISLLYILPVLLAKDKRTDGTSWTVFPNSSAHSYWFSIQSNALTVSRSRKPVVSVGYYNQMVTTGDVIHRRFTLNRFHSLGMYPYIKEW